MLKHEIDQMVKFQVVEYITSTVHVQTFGCPRGVKKYRLDCLSIPERGGCAADPPHPVHAQLTGRALVGQGLELEQQEG